MLSIVIPLYNKIDSVKRCIDSILQQDYYEYELIIVDDGSTDGSGLLIEKTYNNNHIRFFRTKNYGVSSARNKGIKEAVGEFIMFIDADDYISEGYLSRIMKKTEEHYADVYIWGITKDDSKGRQLPMAPNISGLIHRKKFFSLFVKEQYSCHQGLYGYVSNKLMRTSIIKENDLLFNTSMKLMEDYDFFLSYYALCETLYCFEETGYHYVDYSDVAIQTTHDRNYIQLIDVHEKCRSILEHNEALSSDNIIIINKAIGDLSLAMFLEMRDFSKETIKAKLRLLHDRSHALAAFSELKTNKRLLKQIILNNRVTIIFCYLTIWNWYLKIRTK